MRKYIVYQTTNLINNKIYIGVHITNNSEKFDGYLGCGVNINSPYFILHPKTPFQYAVKKYGTNAFKRTTLKVFNTKEEALKLEKELVDKDFIKRKDTYNIALGGNCGNYYFPINQFDKQGNLIKKWDNMAEAAEALGVSHTSINNAKLNKGSCLGYLWSIYDTINIEEFSWSEGTNVYKYNENGELVQIFASLSEACHEIGDKEKTIYRAIQSEIKRKGYYYSFKLVEQFVPRKIFIKNLKLYIYDIEGNYLLTLNNGKEIQNYFNLTSYTNLKMAILQNKPFKGVQISLEKVEKMNKAELPKNISKKVGRYDLENNLIETFNSVRDAIKIWGQGVNKILNGRQKQTKGFVFKFIN